MLDFKNIVMNNLKRLIKMTKIKVVDEATIKCVKPKDIKIGDYILWSNFKCKVIEIYGNSPILSDCPFLLVEQFLGEPESRMPIPRYVYYYKIIDEMFKQIEV